MARFHGYPPALPTNIFHGSEFVFAHVFGIHGGSTAEAALGLVAAGIAQVAGFIGDGAAVLAGIGHKKTSLLNEFKGFQLQGSGA
jgi:hypothetical protein